MKPTLLQKLFIAADALKAGQSLQNPAKWKNVQLIMTPMLVIVSAIFVFLGVDLDEHQVNAIAFGLSTLGTILFNAYFTVATTDKIGVQPKSKGS